MKKLLIIILCAAINCGAQNITYDWFNLETRINAQTYNVIDYGIVGDGVTDNYAAIVALFSLVENMPGTKILYFPDGVYLVSNGSIVPSDVWIFGESISGTILKTTIEQMGLGISIFYTNGDNIRFNTFSLDGSYPNDPAWTYSHDESDYPDRSGGIELKVGARNIRIENINASNMTRNGLLIRGENIFVNNITSTNCIAANIKIGGTGEATIPTGGSGANSTNGVIITNVDLQKTLANHNIELNDGVHNIIINGFTIYGELKCPSISIHDHSGPNETNTNIVIKNGVIVDPAAGTVAILLEQQVNTNKNLNVEFENITVTNGGHYVARVGGNNNNLSFTNVNSQCQRGYNLFALPGLTPARNVRFINCDILPFSVAADDNLPGINALETDSLFVINSTSSNWRAYGISLTNCNNVFITESSFLNCGRSQVDGASIKLIGSGVNVNFNSINIGNDGTSDSKYALIYVAGYDDLIMRNSNVVENANISNVLGSFAGTHCIINNNTGISNYP